jgi:CMP-N-acetylneuraminic acid synthetase
MKVMAIILARGGSKRIPNKNIADLAGKPLIYYTIEAAKKSKYIDKIVVSTNDEAIAKIAIKHGADVPFYRPSNISKWDSTEYEAIEYTLDAMKVVKHYSPDLIVKLYPTSPFRTTKSIDQAIKLAIDNPTVDGVRSVRRVKEHPYKMWTIDKRNRLRNLIATRKEKHTLSIQLLPQVYVNGVSIDVIWPRTILKKHSVTGTNIIPYIMNEEEAFDINTPLDLEIANYLMKRRKHD